MATFETLSDRWGMGELAIIIVEGENGRVLLSDRDNDVYKRGTKMEYNGIQLRFTLSNGVVYIVFNDTPGSIARHSPPKSIGEMYKDFGGK